MSLLHRARNLRSWLGKAPVSRWRVRRLDCLHCGGRFAFSLDGHPARSRCLSCRLTGTALALLPVLTEHVRANPTPGGTAWEMSTHGPVRPFLAKHGLTTIETEFLPGIPSGTIVKGTRCEDVTACSFTDASLDILTSNQVFEHVEEDIQGYRECHRILRPGGAMIFTVPLGTAPETTKVADTHEGKVVFRGKPEYHASRLTGPNSVPVFWRFSRKDLLARVAEAGFQAEWRQVPYMPGSKAVSWIVYARKPA